MTKLLQHKAKTMVKIAEHTSIQFRFMRQARCSGQQKKRCTGGGSTLKECDGPTETSVTEFCFKIVNLSLEELRNINIILFLIYKLFRQPNRPQNKSFFNQHDSSLGRYANAALRKSIEIQRQSITKPKTHFERKFV